MLDRYYFVVSIELWVFCICTPRAIIKTRGEFHIGMADGRGVVSNM